MRMDKYRLYLIILHELFIKRFVIISMHLINIVDSRYGFVKVQISTCFNLLNAL